MTSVRAAFPKSPQPEAVQQIQKMMTAGGVSRILSSRAMVEHTAGRKVLHCGTNTPIVVDRMGVTDGCAMANRHFPHRLSAGSSMVRSPPARFARAAQINPTAGAIGALKASK